MSEQEINNGLRWYVIHTYSGYENKVKTDIEKMVDNRGLNDLVKEVKHQWSWTLHRFSQWTDEFESELLSSGRENPANYHIIGGAF